MVREGWSSGKRQWVMSLTSAMAKLLVMGLSNLDLNLLVSLDALLDQRSVTRAAQQPGLSRPAGTCWSIATCPRRWNGGSRHTARHPAARVPQSGRPWPYRPDGDLGPLQCAALGQPGLFHPHELGSRTGGLLACLEHAAVGLPADRRGHVVDPRGLPFDQVEGEAGDVADIAGPLEGEFGEGAGRSECGPSPIPMTSRSCGCGRPDEQSAAMVWCGQRRRRRWMGSASAVMRAEVSAPRRT